MPNFVILEDHALVRDGLRALLQAKVPDAKVLYSGPSLPDALSVAANTACDCAICDLDLGDGVTPVEVVSTFVRQGVPVLVVSALGEPEVIRSALTAGACAYVTKSAPTQELLAVIEHVLNGWTWVTHDHAELMAQSPDEIDLSERERTALTLYASGLTLESVARHMNVSRNTAKTYLDRVRTKFERTGRRARTKIELSDAARSTGLL
jgi:DNA-binding NarL/FixJ family response regulator